MVEPFPINPDAVKQIRNDVLKQARLQGNLNPSDEAILGLEFQPGEEIIERDTGQRYEVIAGTRRTVAI